MHSKQKHLWKKLLKGIVYFQIWKVCILQGVPLWYVQLQLAIFLSKIENQVLNRVYTLYIIIDQTPISTFCFIVDLSENHLSYIPRQMIPNFLALDIGLKLSQTQIYSSIRGCHATFLVKKTLFKGEVAWQPLKELQICSSRILDP